MKKTLIMSLLFMFTFSFAEEVMENEQAKGFYLKQVDYRHRGSVSISVPGTIRLRLRPSYEYRYTAEKEIIPVKIESTPDKLEKN